MDPLSGVASIIAVISLAVQLGQTALNVKQLLDTISNAPSEVTRLKDIIFQLHVIANSIKTLLDQQKTQQREDVLLSNAIHHSLKTCQNKLDFIEDVLQKAGHVKKKGTLVSRSWAHFRLACKREQIEEFEGQLGLAIAILNVNLTLHLIHSKPTIYSTFGAIAIPAEQQLVSDSEGIICMKRGPSYRPSDQRAATGSSVIPITSSPSEVSVHNAWSQGHKFNVHYKLNGKTQRYSLMLRAKVSRSHMIIAQLSGPFFSICSSIAFNISIRNLVPNDAAIIEACRSGDSRGVRDLLRSGTAGSNDMTPSNDTPLSIAIKTGFEEVVQLLLREGANPNIPCGRFETSPLQIAVIFEKPSIVRMLVQYGADMDYHSTRGWSLLHHLFDNNRSTTNAEYFSIFRQCLSFDDVKDSEGWTSLHRCAAFGTAEDIHFLYLAGASICLDQYVTNCGWSPIHVAALMNNVSTLEALANKLPKPSIDTLHSVDFHGWTPIHLAVYRHATDTMKWLLHSGADLHRTTYRSAGWFPVGYEGEAFDVIDLAKLSGKEFLEAFVESLREVGYDVTTDGEDVYWPSDDSPIIISGNEL